MIVSFGEFGMWPLSWGGTVMLDSALEKSEDARLPRESLRQGQEEEGQWEQAILVSFGEQEVIILVS